MTKTQIVATIGPASESEETLKYFADHNVKIAKLKTAYNTYEWHQAMGLKLKEIGIEVWFDMTGPKMIFGDLGEGVELADGELIIVTSTTQKLTVEDDTKVLPISYDLSADAQPGQLLLALDGLLQIEVQETRDQNLYCKVLTGGTLLTSKALLAPGMDIQLDPIVPEDVAYLEANLNAVQPEWIALSFVKTVDDVNKFKEVVEKIKTDDNYHPKYAVKIETIPALEDNNLSEILDASDMAIVARGDLALEILPLHTNVPFSQAKIVGAARKTDTEVCVATQLVSSMVDEPVPTRAESSDLYRAIYIDKAEYLYLSQETAIGKYPHEVVKFVSDMIEYETGD